MDQSPCPCLSIKFVFTPEQQSRVSAHSKAFAAQTHPNRGRVPRFGYFEREKVSAWELSDDSCFAKSKHRLSEKRSFSTVSGSPSGKPPFIIILEYLRAQARRSARSRFCCAQSLRDTARIPPPPCATRCRSLPTAAAAQESVCRGCRCPDRTPPSPSPHPWYGT